MRDFLNLDILLSPINWVIIWLVLALAGVALSIIVKSQKHMPEGA
jgi:hypothetical protein